MILRRTRPDRGLCLLRRCADALAQEAKPSAARRSGDNAALQYWQAFALMPTLDKEQEKLLQE